ncbi:MAG: NYN domain-containing protein [Gemmatales bacterium]|nr:NYN domain-containing protein [Gemmatales bacterium]
MLYLVDGYNVLYASGYLKRGSDSGAAERARRALLQRIVGALGAEAEQVIVLFDAARAPHCMSREEKFGPVTVRFSPRSQDADSVMESLLSGYASAQVVVVSADRRLRQAARRHKCRAWSPEQFLAWLEKRRRQRIQGRQSANDKLSPALPDKDTWLREFAHLDQDPSLGEPEPFAALDPESLSLENQDRPPRPPPFRR